MEAISRGIRPANMAFRAYCVAVGRMLQNRESSTESIVFTDDGIKNTPLIESQIIDQNDKYFLFLIHKRE